MVIKSINYGGKPIAPRPAMYGREVAEAVFDEIKYELVENLERYEPAHIDRCKKNFVDAATRAGHDGYAVARYLENFCNWRCNAQIVNVIDNAPWEENYRFFVQQWLDYWKLEPLFKVGDSVIAKHGYQTIESTIETVSGKGQIPGTYTLKETCEGGRWGRAVVNWEDCQAAAK